MASAKVKARLRALRRKYGLGEFSRRRRGVPRSRARRRRTGQRRAFRIKTAGWGLM